MPANVEGMVREGLNAYRAGKKDEARALLLRAVEIDQYNEDAWLWLSAVVDTPEEQRTCLENVITINPNNERAKQGLDMLSKKGGASPPAGPTPSDEDVLASTMMSSSGDEMPTSIDWAGNPAPPPAPGTATSSSSSYFHVNEPSAQEYDSWVANLGLGAGGEQPAQAITPAPSPAFSSAFVDDDEDLFGLNDSALSGSESQTLPPPAKATTPAQPSRPPADKVMSPAPKPSATPRPSSSALLDEIDDDEDLMDDLDEDYDQAQLDKLGPEEMFRYIPKEIKATRLPGTRERYPIPVIVGLIVAVLLNIGAIVFLVSQLGATGS